MGENLVKIIEDMFLEQRSVRHRGRSAKRQGCPPDRDQHAGGPRDHRKRTCAKLALLVGVNDDRSQWAIALRDALQAGLDVIRGYFGNATMRFGC